MKIVIIQEAGRHEKNKNFRESLNLHRALSRIEEVESKVWGLNYPDFNISFSEIEVWADVIFIIENYTPEWLPVSQIANSKKLKIFWSIDSHYFGVLEKHKNLCKLLGVDILLNSTESYLPNFDGLVKKSYWFPNSYPDEVIFPKDIEKTTDVGFCGNDRPEIHYLDKFKIKKDLFVIGDDMVNAINSYKIHFNKNISDDINYRTFETTGCGTFLLTNYTPGLEKLFDIGKEIVVYNDLNDLDNKVKYYLENEEEREKIAKSGYERSKKDHTYYERAKTLVDIINDNKKIMNKKKVVILVMCSSTLPLYDNLKNGIKETWFNDRNDDVEVIFYSDNVNYQNKSYYPILEGNDLILPCDDGVHNCGVKTILALDWISKNYEYDYIYRSNLGSYVNINNLLSFLSDKPKDKFYCGIFGFDNFYLNRPVKFVSGSGYFLSKDLVDLILNNKDLWNHRAIDDVALGDFMERFNININESARRINICSGRIDYNIGDKFVETIPDNELYHFRLRSDNRDEDLKSMKEIHEKNNIEML